MNYELLVQCLILHIFDNHNDDSIILLWLGVIEWFLLITCENEIEPKKKKAGEEHRKLNFISISF